MAMGGFGALSTTKLRTCRDLLGREGEFGVDLRADGAVGVIPGVVDARVDERAQPRFVEQVVDVGLAEAGGHAGEQFVVEAVSQAAQGAVEHVLACRGARR